MNNNLIEVKNISKSYDEVVAVSRLSMKVKKGSITGFLGPNGAGKSTTLKIIMGDLQTDATHNSEVHVFGEKPWNNHVIKKRIGFVSEYEDFYDFMTAFDYVKTLARFYMSQEAAKRRTAEVLRMVKLEKDVWTTRKLADFSKGMKQKVKLAVALAHNPELLILDEPFGGLDPISRRQMKNLIMNLNESRGVTVLMSSHILYEVEELSNRMILIHRGQVVASGKPAKIVELIDRYPHTISFQGPQSQLKTLIHELLNLNLISALNLEEIPEENLARYEITTEDPTSFYRKVTEIVAKNNLVIKHMASSTESIEAIFEYLT